MKKSFLAVLVLIAMVSSAFALPGVKQWKLMWDANTESDLAGYKVYWSTTSGVFTDLESIDVGNVLECPLSLLPLVDQTKYHFVITAYDMAENESDFSSEVSHFFDQSAPSAVINLGKKKIN